MAWNKSSENGEAVSRPLQKREGFRFPVRGAIAGAIVVVGAGIAAWWLWPEGETQRDTTPARKGLIRESKPSVRVRAPEPVRATTNETLAKLAKPKIPVGNVITAQSANVGRVESHVDGNVVTTRYEIVFQRPFERALHAALRPGGFGASAIMSMQHRYTEDQIVGMLKEITRPEPEDGADVAALKNRVQKLKEDMLVEIQNGRTAKEVLEDMRRQCATERGIQNDVDRVIRQASQTGDAKTVRDTVEKTNRILEKNGLAPGRVPPQFRREIAEIEAAERAAAAEKLRNDTEDLNKAINESIQ